MLGEFFILFLDFIEFEELIKCGKTCKKFKRIMNLYINILMRNNNLTKEKFIMIYKGSLKIQPKISLLKYSHFKKSALKYYESYIFSCYTKEDIIMLEENGEDKEVDEYLYENIFRKLPKS